MRRRFALLLVIALSMISASAHTADTVTSSTVSSSTVVDKAPPTASSPSVVVNNSDICRAGSSVALQTSLFGVSGGGTSRDENCEVLKLSRAIYGMGLKVAGISLLCADFRVWDALWMAGTPCPYLGAIGEEARVQWLANPHKAPDGVMIFVEPVVVKSVWVDSFGDQEDRGGPQ
tara:strand:- start:1916 stop:2440 length:525 start_codon:yes stop_codon:yes gene_type:complete